MAEFHLIQYRVFGEHHTTVLCPEHRASLLTKMREAGIGCLATSAPSLSRCDRCETEGGVR